MYFNTEAEDQKNKKIKIKMEAGGAFVAHADWLFSCQSSVGDYSLHTLRASLPGTFSEEGCKPALGVRSLYCVLRTATPRQLDFLPEGGTIVSTETIGIWFTDLYEGTNTG